MIVITHNIGFVQNLNSKNYNNISSNTKELSKIIQFNNF